ncbi:MAG TPA: phosphate signaling complex protein PhoU, partial [Stellaceae bacterium]|nr:phosphate signaling complex protein PhoU [Stellaceae bacterium]
MVSEHIIKSYDQELQRLDNIISEMGGLSESQLAAAIEAVAKRDSELAARVVKGDSRVDELEREVESLVVRLLALRQPMARDLRQIVAALKTATDLERICDYAANVAKRSIALNQTPAVRPVYAVPRMGRLCQGMIKDMLDAYVERDADKA